VNPYTVLPEERNSRRKMVTITEEGTPKKGRGKKFLLHREETLDKGPIGEREGAFRSGSLRKGWR